MSGIEVAGLVLGALPLLLSGLEYFQEGLIPLKDFVQFEMIIRELRRRLQNAQIRFRNTCEKLLSGLLSDGDGSLLLTLLENPGGPEWHTADLKQKIQRRLQNSYETFMETVAYMGIQLDDLRQVIGLDDKGMPSWVNLRHSKHRRLIDWRRSGASTWKRITVSLSHNEHERHLVKIDAGNLDLEKMTQDSIDLEPLRVKRSWLGDLSSWNNKRDCLKGLFEALRKGWPPDCRHAHKANLRLEALQILRGYTEDIPITMHFESAHPLSWDWREAEIKPSQVAIIEPLESRTLPVHPRPRAVTFQINTPDTAAQIPTRSHNSSSLPGVTKIENLCAALDGLNAFPNCVGYLDDGCFRHHFYSPMKSFLRSPPNSVTLQEVLSGNSSIKISDFSAKEKYELALILATTVLQLYSTPWLEENWRRSDIHFLQNASGERLVRQTYVCHTFSTYDTSVPLLSSDSNSESICPAIRNKCIFRLGVLLLELAFGKTLDRCEQECDLDHGYRTIYTELQTARRLVKELEFDRREGERYVGAVNRCINCIFDGTDPSLDNNKFKQAFYQGVIEPLEGIVRDVSF